MTQEEKEKKEGKYIYCIIGANEEEKFGPLGIGERGDEVYSISQEGLAAVISNSPVMKYPISRKNTLAHQKVMEELMKKGYTVLPVRFSTIAEERKGKSPEEMIRGKVFNERHEEFEELLATMANKEELGIKALWSDMDAVYREILEENPSIKNLRDKLKGKPKKVIHSQKAELGEMVMKALEAKRKRLADKIMEPLKKISVDYRNNKCFGDSMIMNGAFLVEKGRVPEVDKYVDELDERLGARIKFKYVGPIPPINFIEIVIHWE